MPCVREPPLTSTGCQPNFGPEVGPVVVVAEHVGQVLVQPAAVRDGHQLHAPADREQGQVGVERGAQQHQLRGVALGLDLGGGVRPLAVQGRVDVGAAGEHDAVESVEDVDVGIVGRDEHGPAAAAVHGVDVGERAAPPRTCR